MFYAFPSVCLLLALTFNVMHNIHGKQLRACSDGHSVPRQVYIEADYQYWVHISLFMLNSAEHEISIPHKYLNSSK